MLRDTFKKALSRARQEFGSTGGDIECGGEGYRLLNQLGKGEFSDVYLARRVSGLPFLATIKLSSASGAATHYAREAEVLHDLRTSSHEARKTYGAQHLPWVIFQGPVKDAPGRQALVLHHEPGYWGSLAALHARFPQGLDPRHAVWIWRRMLDVLHFLHMEDWTHGDVRPEHALVHPENHGVRIIGWASARRSSDASAKAHDLQRCARVITVLLCGAHASGSLPPQVPHQLAKLVTQASEDATFCQAHPAKHQDALLKEAALAAFGPPSFVPLIV